MELVYPAKLTHTAPGEVLVTFRDLPESLTSGIDERDACVEAVDALEEAIMGRIVDGDPIPAPSACGPDERNVPVPPATAALATEIQEAG